MEYEFVTMQVGKRFPFEDVLEKMGNGDGGASLNYLKDEQILNMYITIPNPNKMEIKEFRNGVIRFALYPNFMLDTAIIMVCFGKEFIFELLYDINVLDMDMSGRVLGNRFDIFLIDSKTGILCGMRSIGLGREFMKQINRITKNNGRYTSAEYNEWLNNNVFKKDLKQLWRESERIDWDI